MLLRTVGQQLVRAALLFGQSCDDDAAERTRLGLSVADDPIGAVLNMASFAVSAPRDLVMATKATMGPTSIPGTADGDLHAAAADIELGLQAKSLNG